MAGVPSLPPAASGSLLFDQGPSTGTRSACWSNRDDFDSGQHFSDRFRLSGAAQVHAISIFTCISPRAGLVRIKVLSSATGGYLYTADVTPDSRTLTPGGLYEVRATLPTPFPAAAGTDYWIGMSGLNLQLGQYGVIAPDDSRMSQFNGSSFSIMTGTFVGDQMFKLFGPSQEPENQPPTADAGEDQTVECNTTSGGEVTLDGTGSTDPDAGDPLIYTWKDSDGNTVAAGASPTVTLPLGSHTLTLEVSDGQATDTDEVTVVVEDTAVPAVSASLQWISLPRTTGGGITGGEEEDEAGGPVTIGTDRGYFRVRYSCRDACDPRAVITSARLNGVPVGNREIVFLAHEENPEGEDAGQERRTSSGHLKFEDSSFVLVVRCRDASGHESTATFRLSLGGSNRGGGEG